MHTSRTILAALALPCVLALPAPLLALEDEPAAEAQPPEVTIGSPGSAQDPLAGRDPLVPVEPERGLAVNQVEQRLGMPPVHLKIDRRVLGIAPGDPLPQLRREGETLRKRDGQLLPAEGRGLSVFLIEPDIEAGEMTKLGVVLAPCMALESMERMMEDSEEELRFTITGQVHTYRGVNFLLPTAQPKPWVVTGAEAGDEAGDEALDAASADTAGDTDGEVDADGDGTEAGDADAPLTADDVISDLLDKRPPPPAGHGETTSKQGRSLPDPTGSLTLTDPLLESLDPDQPQAKLKDEGAFIIARTGRLVQSADGSHAMFVLDGDRAGAPEPPMILHACKLLEVMEKTVREQGEDVPFVVTGQVFVYRGANYLLPTIVKRKFERGNLE